jgi:hypothetical protein
MAQNAHRKQKKMAPHHVVTWFMHYLVIVLLKEHK